MNKTLLIIIILIIIFAGGLIIFFPKQNQESLDSQKIEGDKTSTINSKSMNNFKTIRQPAVAGQFYPDDPKELESLINQYLSNVETPSLASQNQIPQILIVPHAGYVFSGQTAAYAFKTLENQNYDTVVLLGSSHNFPIQELVLYTGDAIQTPLGLVPVNQPMTQDLIQANKQIIANDDIHQPEHSLEVEIPFLQKVLDNFKIVLGLINNDDLDQLESMADSIKKVLEKYPSTLIVISSDLSHYPSYDDAIYSDNKIIQSILTQNPKNLTQTINSIMAENRPGLDTCACGSSAIKLAMFIANKLNLDGQVLHYSNSGDIEEYGDKNKVVGYGAVVFTANSSKLTADDSKLNTDEQQAALKLARNTLELEFSLTQDKFEDYKNYPTFSEKRGVFVTLRIENQLRGCIGLIEPIKPLAEGIIEMAKAAAFNDSRFTPLTKEEFNHTEIEVSVLTPPQKINDPEKEIELGRHGVIVRSGNNSGVYLPQVATETGWDLQTFMESLCTSKAYLPANCWKNSQANIYTFEAQVFEE